MDKRVTKEFAKEYMQELNKHIERHAKSTDAYSEGLVTGYASAMAIFYDMIERYGIEL